MTPYAFWCSRCKISHAGECAVVEEYKSKAGWPAIGSKWHVLTKQDDGSWLRQDIRTFEVVRWVLTEMLVYLSAESGPEMSTGNPIEMWTDPDGAKPYSNRVKMVPAI